MTGVFGILAWIITLFPLLWKVGKWIFAVAARVAPKAAGAGVAVTIWATIAHVLISTGIISGLVWFVYSQRFTMYAIAARASLPVIRWSVDMVVAAVNNYMPQIGGNQYFDACMGFAVSFDYATPITILIMGFSLSLTVGSFMRSVRI